MQLADLSFFNLSPHFLSLVSLSKVGYPENQKMGIVCFCFCFVGDEYEYEYMMNE